MQNLKLKFDAPKEQFMASIKKQSIKQKHIIENANFIHDVKFMKHFAKVAVSVEGISAWQFEIFIEFVEWIKELGKKLKNICEKKLPDIIDFKILPFESYIKREISCNHYIDMGNDIYLKWIKWAVEIIKGIWIKFQMKPKNCINK